MLYKVLYSKVTIDFYKPFHITLSNTLPPLSFVVASTGMI